MNSRSAGERNPAPPRRGLDEHRCDLVLGFGHVAEEGRVPVAHDQGAVELTDTRQRLRGLRADRNVSEADDLVDVLALELGKHSLERRAVAVDVRDQADAHAADSL
jgi:hypothetical protein